MARVLSTPTTIVVNAVSGPKTLMQLVIEDSSGWTHNPGTPAFSGFKHFECDPANRNSPDYRHMSDWYYHYWQSNSPGSYGKCEVTTDGYLTGGSDPYFQYFSGEEFHLATNWSGKGVYDPIRKRVQWMTKGTGSGKNEWHFNTLPIYRMGLNETEGWKVIRGWRATTPPDVDNVNKGPPLTHFFYNNCIDVVGRRHYKKQFQTSNLTNLDDIGYSGPFHVFNLDTEMWEPSILAPSWDPYGMGMGPCEFIPTRGVRGVLWYINGNQLRMVEYDVTTGTGQRTDWVDVPGFALADDPFPKIAHNFNMNVNMGIMCGNPRAFGGTGAVLVCGGGDYPATGGVRGVSYIVTTPPSGITPTKYEIPSTNLPSDMSFGQGANLSEGKICPHPTLGGWLMFGSKQPAGTNKVWYLEDSPTAIWQDTGYLVPYVGYGSGLGPVTTMEEFGVVWLIYSRPSGVNLATVPRAFIFKP